ncbi:NUDIX hydrolase domain-like protein [Bombardia bombarda]|uniref:NUDIX hydrolase domain-like protein n=1 Tax=Bombardia bombarda TaxID=252184 RepID=A0AA39XL89_9PEZI|nr:NUDIX hydrolase domain-like protein [Bombardia bombarda]
MSEPTEKAGTTAPPPYTFTADESLDPWNISAPEWLTQHQSPLDGLAVGAVVFDPQGRILLVQRAAHDSMPNKWEIPGGGADDTDLTVLHAAARELWEESGLVARRFTHIVTEGPGSELGHVFPNRNCTKHFCRFVFATEVESCAVVTLDPNEHQDYLWATEDEVRAQMVGDRSIEITQRVMHAVLLEGFRLRRERLA